LGAGGTSGSSRAVKTAQAPKREIGAARTRAALAVNEELIGLYWRIGAEILVRQEHEGWGTRVAKRLSVDLREAFPDMKGLSETNLRHMRAFAQAWPERDTCVCNWLPASRRSQSASPGFDRFRGHADNATHDLRQNARSTTPTRPASLIRDRQRETKTPQFARRPAGKATKRRPCDSRGAVAGITLTLSIRPTSRTY
jgi:DUF1016 N-terminal domain